MEPFNDRAIPASQRYPDKPTPAPVNFDMGRHVDDRVERCQEDFGEYAGLQVVYDNSVPEIVCELMPDGKYQYRYFNRDPGDEHEDGRRFTNRNA